MRIERQALHCSLLSFRHPENGEERVFKVLCLRNLKDLC